MSENKIPYEEGWIILDKKQYWFMKRSAADVDISDDKDYPPFEGKPYAICTDYPSTIK